jgi:hypothetical protein
MGRLLQWIFRLKPEATGVTADFRLEPEAIGRAYLRQ